jgi:hypothetical protein
MDNDPHPGRLPSSLGGVLHLWRRILRAARAAEETYTTDRAHGVAHNIAAREAFEVLTRDDQPAAPEIVSGTGATPADGAADHHDRPRIAVPLSSFRTA